SRVRLPYVRNAARLIAASVVPNGGHCRFALKPGKYHRGLHQSLVFDPDVTFSFRVLASLVGVEIPNDTHVGFNVAYGVYRLSDAGDFAAVIQKAQGDGNVRFERDVIES